MEKSWNFVNKFDETTSSQKTSCQTHKTCVIDSQFSGYWWFQVLIISKFMRSLQACLFKYITVAAFRIYAQRGEDAAKRGCWKPCIKWSWKLHC